MSIDDREGDIENEGGLGTLRWLPLSVSCGGAMAERSRPNISKDCRLRSCPHDRCAENDSEAPLILRESEMKALHQFTIDVQQRGVHTMSSVGCIRWQYRELGKYLAFESGPKVLDKSAWSYKNILNARDRSVPRHSPHCTSAYVASYLNTTDVI